MSPKKGVHCFILSLMWIRFYKSVSKRLVYKWYFCVYPCSPFQPPYIPVKWGLPLDPVSNQPTGLLLLFCNNILISSDCCFDEGLLLLLLIYWSTELTPTWVIKYHWKQGNGPPALLVSAFPLSLPFHSCLFFPLFLRLFVIFLVFHWFLTCFIFSCFLPSLISLISYLLLLVELVRDA